MQPINESMLSGAMFPFSTLPFPPPYVHSLLHCSSSSSTCLFTFLPIFSNINPKDGMKLEIICSLQGNLLFLLCCIRQMTYPDRPLEFLRSFLLTKHSDANNFYLVWDVMFSVNINYPGIHCRQWNCLVENPLALSSPHFFDVISNILGSREQLKK